MPTRPKRALQQRVETNQPNPYELSWGKRNGGFVEVNLTIGTRRITRKFGIVNGSINRQAVITWLTSNDVNKNHQEDLVNKLFTQKIPR